MNGERAFSSAVERSVHIGKAIGPTPIMPTNFMRTNWKNNFKNGKDLILSTSSKNGFPNANVVISCGFVDDKLLVADCQMVTTINNLKENPKISVIAGYIRLKGTVEIFSTGKYFDLCVGKSKGYDVKNAVVIKMRKFLI